MSKTASYDELPDAGRVVPGDVALRVSRREFAKPKARLALIAEFENDIRRERQMDGIAKAKERGVKFGRKSGLTRERVEEIKALRGAGTTVPEIRRQMKLSKASVYRALSG